MVTLRDPHNVPAHISLVLFYGPNEGLVQERRKQLLEQWKQGDDFGGDFGGDFFDVSFLSCDDLRGQAGRLVNEAASLSLGGQERLVVVDAIDERCLFCHTHLFGIPANRRARYFDMRPPKTAFKSQARG